MTKSYRQRVLGATFGALLVAVAWGATSLTQSAEEPLLIGSRTFEVNGDSEDLIRFAEALVASGDAEGFRLNMSDKGHSATVWLPDDATGRMVVAVAGHAARSGLNYSYMATLPTS